MYAQVGDFRVSRGPPTVPLMQISLNAVFSSPKICKRQKPSVLCFQSKGGLSETLLFILLASGRSLKFIEDKINLEVLPWYANTHTTTTITGW